MSSKPHGYQQTIGIPLAVWQGCVTGEVGSGENWKCFLCFVNRVLMFALFGNLECQEKSQHLKAGKRHRTEKKMLKSRSFLFGGHCWRKSCRMLVTFEWTKNELSYINISVHGPDRKPSSLLVGQSCCSWGSELWWQHSRALLMYSLNLSTGINLRAVTHCSMLSWKK